MSRWGGNEVAGPVSRAASVLADRARSECARSMRAIEADPPHRPAVVVKGEINKERGRPNTLSCSRNAHDQNVLVGRAQ